MDLFLQILGYVSGPLIGAIIGYFTNYIAVKMLFRPYYPKRIGKWQIPFTPGIIPKRQKALAKAIGKAVGENLLTGDDLKAAFVGERAERSVAALAVRTVREKGDETANRAAESMLGAEAWQADKEKFAHYLTDRLVETAQDMHVGKLVAEEGAKVLAQKKASLGMLALLLSDGALRSVLDAAAGKIDEYIATEGKEKAYPVVLKKVEELSAKPVSEWSASISDEAISAFAVGAYRAVAGKIGDVFKEIDIASVVEEKVAAMNVKELEQLCLSVMKKELSAIVNLGALIGFLLGIVNIFI